MASGVSDAIESFIKALLQGDETQVELQRNELAARFGCAPSQINYVLSTRFTCKHGYRIESRRGGGGYVRVCRIDADKASALQALCEAMPETLNGQEAKELLGLALQAGLVDQAGGLATLRGHGRSAASRRPRRPPSRSPAPKARCFS